MQKEKFFDLEIQDDKKKNSSMTVMDKLFFPPCTSWNNARQEQQATARRTQIARSQTMQLRNYKCRKFKPREKPEKKFPFPRESSFLIFLMAADRCTAGELITSSSISGYDEAVNFPPVGQRDLFSWLCPPTPERSAPRNSLATNFNFTVGETLHKGALGQKSHGRKYFCCCLKTTFWYIVMFRCVLWFGVIYTFLNHTKTDFFI